ncbi:hypothetical protein C5167_028499 [Papaver somniferum]|nr:hypothetical protein C5167_028499 [Papaver somniferum]
MIPLGFIAAVSVRVSNELGAGNAAAAKFSVWVTIVMKEVSNLAIYFCSSIILCGVQPVLTGIAIGAGWQANVAYVNIVTYYLIGLPIGVFMGFKLDWGLEGLWVGAQIGIGLQTMVQLSKDRVSEDVETSREDANVETTTALVPIASVNEGNDEDGGLFTCRQSLMMK